MFREEAKREDGIQAVSIATPNGTHYEITKAALEAGLHVVCEKPLCFTIEQAEELAYLAKKQKKVVGITYGYAGHQMIEEARQLIKAGKLGDIRIVMLQFAHGFHNKEFPWKIDIQIYCSEECWEVQIRDNGCGMDQEELEKLELELLEMRNRDVKSLMKELKIGGLTIKNVYLRLFLAYGNNMIFDISNKSEGMCITVGENYENTCTGS